MVERGHSDRVLVRRSPDSPALEIEVAELDGFHWTMWTGRFAHFFSDWMLAAYMSCSAIPAGFREEFGHSCKTDPPPPHRIKVLIEKKRRYSVTYSKLAKLAGESLKR